MKKTIILSSAACLVLAAASCDREANPSERIENSEKAEITVNLSGEGYTLDLPSGTKVSLDENGEKAVNTVQIFIFREDGTLDAYTSESASSGIKLSCTTGKRTIHALVNAPALGGVNNEDDLKAAVTSLADNALGSFVMTGSIIETISAEASYDIEVKRIVSRVSVGTITAAFTSEAYRNMTFTLKRIFMLNVAGNTTYGTEKEPDAWFNKMAWESSACDALLGSANINRTLADKTPYQPDEVFYVYPNPAMSDPDASSFPRCTRLVLETQLGDKTYYYSIKIPGIGRNKKYSVNSVTITRPGSLNPGEDINSSELTFSVVVEPWEEGSSQEITI